jgi:hypothetical protein
MEASMSAMKTRKHPAPVLVFANRKANAPAPPPAWPAEGRFNQKILQLASVYPDALVEIELLVDDYLNFLRRRGGR